MLLLGSVATDILYFIIVQHHNTPLMDAGIRKTPPIPFTGLHSPTASNASNAFNAVIVYRNHELRKQKAYRNVHRLTLSNTLPPIGNRSCRASES